MRVLVLCRCLSARGEADPIPVSKAWVLQQTKREKMARGRAANQAHIHRPYITTKRRGQPPHLGSQGSVSCIHIGGKIFLYSHYIKANQKRYKEQEVTILFPLNVSVSASLVYHCSVHQSGNRFSEFGGTSNTKSAVFSYRSMVTYVPEHYGVRSAGTWVCNIGRSAE